MPSFIGGILVAIVAGSGVAIAHQDDAARDQYASKRAATRSYDGISEAYDFDEDGYADIVIAYSLCPRGTQMTGGGSANLTRTGLELASAPDLSGKEAWYTAVAIDESVREDPDALVATVVCWSPKGTPSGGYRTAAPAEEVPAEVVAEVRRLRSASMGIRNGGRD